MVPVFHWSSNWWLESLFCQCSCQWNSNGHTIRFSPPITVSNIMRSDGDNLACITVVLQQPAWQRQVGEIDLAASLRYDTICLQDARCVLIPHRKDCSSAEKSPNPPYIFTTVLGHRYICVLSNMVHSALTLFTDSESMHFGDQKRYVKIGNIENMWFNYTL